MRFRPVDKTNPIMREIAKHMTRKSYTDLDIAKGLGVSKNAVSLYWWRLRQGRTLSVHTMNSIARILDMSTDVFFLQEKETSNV